MEKTYFVDWVAYNAETSVWYFKQAEKFDTLDDAKKKFHSILSQKIGYGALTHVSAIIYDECHNVIDREKWDGVWNAPEPEVVEETTAEGTESEV